MFKFKKIKLKINKKDLEKLEELARKMNITIDKTIEEAVKFYQSYIQDLSLERNTKNEGGC